MNTTHDNFKKNMTNTNGFSDSQESALFGDEVFDELKKEVIDIYDLPLSMSDVIEEKPEEPEEEMEQKCNINVMHSYASQGNMLRDENERQYYPKPESPINTKDFPGILNFQLLLPEQNSSKDWVYSQKLGKVFINMEKTLPLRFKWDPPLLGLFLRTQMVFEVDQYKNDPVRRCHNHMAPTNPSNRDMDPLIIKHVVRCKDKSSEYEESNEHLSIITRLPSPQPGSQYVTMYYEFFCKNSCPSGMNRRPTELMFTLEDCKGEPLGYRKLLVRVCSCPKRDKEKEEEAESPGARHVAKKRKLAVPSGKKMMPSFDTHVFNLQLDIVGKENYLAVMKYAFDIMAGQAAKTGQYDFFKPYMDAILRKGP